MGHFEPILYIFSFPIFKFKFEKSTAIFFDLKRIYLVLETFKVNLFDWNHIAAFCNSRLTVINREFKSFDDNWKVMSSANSKVKNLVAFGRSLMNKRNSRGPKTLPCGTPHSICR